MNKEDKFIQDLFSQKLQKAEAPVDPAIWEGISNALPVSGAAAGASASAGFQMGALGWVATGLVAAGIAVSAFVFQSNDETTPKEIAKAEQTFKDETTITPEEVVEPTVSQEKPAEKSELNEATPVEKTQPTATQSQEHEEELSDEIGNPQENVTDATKENDPTPEPITTSEKTGDEQPTKPEAKQPNPELSADFEVLEAPFAELTYEFKPTFSEASTFLWNFGDGTISQEINPSHLFTSQGTYTVSLITTDENGFEQVMEQELKVVLPALLVLPNTFTPDNNGTNDFLLPSVHRKNVEILQMMVFSTKGELLFEQDGEGSGWDGNLADGSPAPKGDYVLIVKAMSSSGENITKQRKVLLQRN